MTLTAPWPPLFLALTLVLSFSAHAEEQEGKFFGAKETEYPAWFKESFLDLREDVADAAKHNKRLMIFFYQDGCPYCNAMVERNLAQKDILELVQKNFDVIAMNMWGDRDVTHTSGEHFSEKTYAEHLKIQFTPTLIFLDEKGDIVLRLNGYRSPHRFKYDVRYVAEKKESSMSYRDFIKANYTPGKSSKTLHKEDFFQPGPHNFKALVGKGKPIAVFFEQKDCPNCDTLHSKVMPDKTTHDIVSQFHVVQLDMWSKTPVIDFSGKELSARDWAAELDVKFAPSIVIFNDQGDEVIRSEAFFKVFHTQGIFAYVLDGAYKEQPSFQRYLADRAEHIREQGKNVDIWNFSGQEPGERK